MNLDDGIHIRIVWSCSNAKNTMSRIFHKILTTGLPVAKILVRYNSNNLEENNEEEKESINIEFTEQKKTLIMMKMLLTLDDQV